MPGFVKTPEDEKRWEKAKKIVEDQKGTAEGNWPLVTHIYKNMKKAALAPTQTGTLYVISPENLQDMMKEGTWEGMSEVLLEPEDLFHSDTHFMDEWVRKYGGAVIDIGDTGVFDAKIPRLEVMEERSAFSRVAARFHSEDRKFLYALETLAREAYEGADHEMYKYAMFVRTWLLRGYALTEEQEDRLQSGFHKYHISPLVGGKMSKNAERLAELYLTAGKVVPFPGSRASGPTVKIRGNQYVLSSDSGPLAGDLEDPIETQEGQAQLVRGPSRGKYKFLWVYNVDRQEISMWRASDGNEKVHSPARVMTQDILRLDKKRQLNRVGTKEYNEIRKYMDDLASDQLKRLNRTIRMTEGEFQKAVNKGVLEFFNKQFRAKVESAIKEVESGVVPFDFKVRDSLLDYVSKEDQLKEHAIRSALKDFGVATAESYLRAKGLPVDSPKVDIQATEWAVQELIPHIYDEYLEGAPRFKFSS